MDVMHWGLETDKNITSKKFHNIIIQLQRDKAKIIEKDVCVGQSYKSGKEKAIAKILANSDIPAFYEPIMLKLPDGKEYPPDFIIGITSSNGNNIYFIEQHSMGNISSGYIIKLKEASCTYMMNFILISDASMEEMAKRLEKENISDFVAMLGEGNLYWSIKDGNYIEVEMGLNKLKAENTLLSAEMLAARISYMKLFGPLYLQKIKRAQE